VRAGWVKVPEQPGVGSWPDEGALAALGAERRWFSAAEYFRTT
jgi:hypothetical protein